MTGKNEKYTLDDKLVARIDEIKKKFPVDEKKSAIIESLLLLQHENNGYHTKELMKSLANYLVVDEIDIYEIATFYTMFNTKPVGRNVIAVCTNVSCMLRGSHVILEHIERRLQSRVGASTKDDKFFIKNDFLCQNQHV